MNQHPDPEEEFARLMTAGEDYSDDNIWRGLGYWLVLLAGLIAACWAAHAAGWL